MRTCKKWCLSCETYHHRSEFYQRAGRCKRSTIALTLAKQKAGYKPKAGKQGTQKIINHTGPVGIQRLFFCDLLPPAYSLELRAARLGL